jgi:hypothetical protein
MSLWFEKKKKNISMKCLVGLLTNWEKQEPFPCILHILYTGQNQGIYIYVQWVLWELICVSLRLSEISCSCNLSLLSFFSLLSSLSYFTATCPKIAGSRIPSLNRIPVSDLQSVSLNSFHLYTGQARQLVPWANRNCIQSHILHTCNIDIYIHCDTHTYSDARNMDAYR